MSDSEQSNKPRSSSDRGEDGLDAGTGDPNDDRAYMIDQPPTQVDDDAVRQNRLESDDA